MIHTFLWLCSEFSDPLGLAKIGHLKGIVANPGYGP